MRRITVGRFGTEEACQRKRFGRFVIRTAVAQPDKVMNKGVPPKKRGKIALRVGGMRAGKKAGQVRLTSSNGGSSEDDRQGNAAMLAALVSHPCLHCTKVFNSPGKLQQHLFVHTGERPFKCHECDKGFSSRFKLMRHALIHSNERRYKCSYCERCFHRKDHLKNHLQVHNPNKKVYRCDQCAKEYNSRLSFRKHVAIHAAEAGDLECKVCGKTFASSDEILYHLKVHSGSRAVKSPNEKKFKCEFCERRFFTRKDVKRHLVVHTGRRDFLCQYCPQRFGRKDHLVRHIKKSHNTPKGGKEFGGSAGDRDLVCGATTEYSPFDYVAAAAAVVQPPLPSPAFTSPGMASTSALLHSPPLPAPLPNSHTVPHQNHHAHHHHHHQRHLDKDVKHFFPPSHLSPGTALSPPAPPLPYCSPPAPSPSTNSMYLLTPYPSDHGSGGDFKMYDEIKTERDDGLVDQLSAPLDIGQLLGFLPYSTTSAGPPTMTPSGVTQSSPSSAAPVMSNSILGSLPIGSAPLPQFNQAFQ